MVWCQGIRAWLSSQRPEVASRRSEVGGEKSDFRGGRFRVSFVDLFFWLKTEIHQTPRKEEL
jgi:hypothetical protein